MIKYKQMPDSEYFAHEYISCSEIKEYSKGANYYIASKLNPKQSDSMDFGKAFHQAILENDFDFTKIWKTKATIEKHTETINKMANALRLYYDFTHNSNEYALFEHGKGLRCKLDSYDQTTHTIYDIKTCQSAKYDDVLKDIFNYKYHWQSKFYIDLVNEYANTDQTEFKFVFIEKTEPFNIIEIALSDEILQLAHDQYSPFIYDLQMLKQSKSNEYTPERQEYLINLDEVPTWLLTKQ